MPGQSHENESGKAGEDLFYELLPFFFTPNQVFVEHKMANATSSISGDKHLSDLSLGLALSRLTQNKHGRRVSW